MSDVLAIVAGKIYDGERWYSDAALVIKNQRIKHIIPSVELPPDIETLHFEDDFISPGFVDLQVNGGGGVLLNNNPSVEGISKICTTHIGLGTTSLLPTLITDTNEVRDAAISAAIEACRRKTPGFAGLHLEGPHLSIARKGAHDPNLIRPMTDDDVGILIAAQSEILMLMITLAPESVAGEQVAALTKAGIKISLGHSNAGIAEIEPLLNAGASMFTHLFNAMSQMRGREPGMVGAALGKSHASIIADGHHVHPMSISNALAAKKGQQGNIFLISDAMSVIGTNATELMLNGRRILRQDGALTLEDGTLAGADIDMASAVRFMHQEINLELGEALRMATRYPAIAAGLEKHGNLKPDAQADFVVLSEDIRVQSTWIAGKKVAI